MTNLQFLDLKQELKINSQIYSQVLEWLGSMTSQIDDESASSFTTFVSQNLKRKHPYGVFVLYDQNESNVIGITSIVPDDQDVGKNNNLQGLWIAGVNIHRDYRHKGYGKILFTHVDSYLDSLQKKPVTVYLFVSNPYAVKIYEQLGFEKTVIEVFHHNKTNSIYKKKYC